MKMPENASRMRIAGWVSGHSPVAATIPVVVSRKIQATIRTTRSYVCVETPSSAVGALDPAHHRRSAARRSASIGGATSRAIGLGRPEHRRDDDDRHHQQVRDDREDDQDQDRRDRQCRPR